MHEKFEARVAAALAKVWLKNSFHFGGCITREPYSQGQACDCGFAELDAIREELGVPSDGFVRERIRAYKEAEEAKAKQARDALTALKAARRRPLTVAMRAMRADYLAIKERQK